MCGMIAMITLLQSLTNQYTPNYDLFYIYLKVLVHPHYKYMPTSYIK